MTDLHVIPPKDYIGVVEAMPLVVAAVENLVHSKTTYELDGDLYFKVRSDPEFGRRSHYTPEQMLTIFA